MHHDVAGKGNPGNEKIRDAPNNKTIIVTVTIYNAKANRRDTLKRGFEGATAIKDPAIPSAFPHAA